MKMVILRLYRYVNPNLSFAQLFIYIFTQCHQRNICSKCQRGLWDESIFSRKMYSYNEDIKIKRNLFS